MKFLRFTLPENVNKRMPSTRLDTFREKILVPMMGNVDPGKNIAIDEALVLWKGRLGFRQFIKTKRARFGIKVFVMCNSEKEWSGYCYNFQIYYGKETSDSYVLPNVPGANELSISEKIVVHLANSVLGQGRHIFVDSWYSSIRLAHFLLTQETLMTGTIRPDRGVPNELRGEKLINHQASFVRKDNTLIVKWNDKREVYVISTCYESTLFVEKQQVLPGGRKISFKKPHMIEKYNDFMGGVDKADQLLEPIDPSRKSLAWFKKLGLHFIMLLMLNSFLLYKNKVNKKSTIKRFILKAVEEIIETHSPKGIEVREKFIAANPRAGRKRKVEEVIHAFIQLAPTPGGNQKPRKRCRVCKVEKKTRYCCDGCPEKPGICSIEHFKEWHKDVGGGPSTSQ
ncbi:piggyBac transposable element-derived protein 4-like [Palaemon carinicauda]|uniref:piggyBac transposable element-derived protein 4-like n=1 Tax=Palaemon carinicauda TaxID=392227 RepID=UPI0035B60306